MQAVREELQTAPTTPHSGAAQAPASVNRYYVSKKGRRFDTTQPPPYPCRRCQNYHWSCFACPPAPVQRPSTPYYQSAGHQNSSRGADRPATAPPPFSPSRALQLPVVRFSPKTEVRVFLPHLPPLFMSLSTPTTPQKPRHPGPLPYPAQRFFFLVPRNPPTHLPHSLSTILPQAPVPSTPGRWTPFSHGQWRMAPTRRHLSLPCSGTCSHLPFPRDLRPPALYWPLSHWHRPPIPKSHVSNGSTGMQLRQFPIWHPHQTGSGLTSPGCLPPPLDSHPVTLCSMAASCWHLPTSYESQKQADSALRTSSTAACVSAPPNLTTEASGEQRACSSANGLSTCGCISPTPRGQVCYSVSFPNECNTTLQESPGIRSDEAELPLLSPSASPRNSWPSGGTKT